MKAMVQYDCRTRLCLCCYRLKQSILLWLRQESFERHFFDHVLFSNALAVTVVYFQVRKYRIPDSSLANDKYFHDGKMETNTCIPPTEVKYRRPVKLRRVVDRLTGGMLPDTTLISDMDSAESGYQPSYLRSVA